LRMGDGDNGNGRGTEYLSYRTIDPFFGAFSQIRRSSVSHP
jgi:hypothetical protein